MNVISISRRTDIPAFYTEWLLNRIQAGYATYVNPYSREAYSISLMPQAVIALVFWTKNAGPLIPHLRELSDRGYHFYFHYTITGHPKSLERNVIPLEEAVHQFKDISRLYTPDHVQWRFDPVMLTDGLDARYYSVIFERIASSIEGYTYRCYMSFAEPYKKVLKNFHKAGITYDDPPVEQKREVAGGLAKIAADHGMSLMACCSDELLMQGVQKARCIDPEIIKRISPHGIGSLQPSPTRKDCGCYKSYDIGAYDTCIHRCLYCYANSDIKRSTKNHRLHRSKDEMLLAANGHCKEHFSSR